MQPDYVIEADSLDITKKIKSRLLEMTVSDISGMESDTLEIVLSDREPRIETPRTGAKLTVKIGYKGDVVKMGVYHVDEISLSGPPAVVTVRARAANLRAAMKNKHTISWDTVTLGDIVSTIAQKHNYSPYIDAELGGFNYDHIDQTNESDIAFLLRLAKLHGATVKPTNDILVFGRYGNIKSLSGKELPTVRLTAEHLTSYRVVMADRNKYTGVKAKWIDYATAKMEYVQAGSGQNIFTLAGDYSSATKAKVAARAKLESFQRGAASLSLSTTGNTDLMAEGKIELAGMRKDVDNTWLIKRATHRINNSGFITDIDAETPGADN